ncbi:MAG: hypothetical protein L3J51_00735 [Cocleimonas sp.]|nr:hypothetical protein [Cocleimonas sp.]
MALPNPKRKRRYNFKRQFRRKLKKIAFMILIAAIFGGTHYYGKFYDDDLIKKKLNENSVIHKQKEKKLR